MDDGDMACYIVNALETMNPEPGLPRVESIDHDLKSDPIRVYMDDGSEFSVIVVPL
jgi:hypothetical protein